MNAETTEKHAGLLEMEKEGTKVTIKNDTRKSNRNRGILIGVVIVLFLVIVIVVSLTVVFLTRKGDKPALKFFPNIEGKSALIRFEQGRQESISQYVDMIDSKLKDYENEEQVGSHFLDCSNLAGYSEPGKICAFRIDILGWRCSKTVQYGYEEGTPCVFLHFKELKGWKPVPYNSTNPPPQYAGISDSSWSDSTVPVTCEGQYNPDKESIGPLTYYPQTGFPAVFFPYSGEEDYRSPLVAVLFERAKSGMIIQVVCKAWAQNIDHTKDSDVATVKFEIMID